MGNHDWDLMADWCRGCHLTAEDLSTVDLVRPCVIGRWLST